jgi:membrane protease YdiL (CAAX protease family)
MHPDDHREEEWSNPKPAAHDPGAGLTTDAAPFSFVPAVTPFARMVVADTCDEGIALTYARRGRDIPWWLAILELITLAFVGLIGAAAAIPIMIMWQPADDRWLSVVATMTAGLAVVAGCVVTLRLERRPLATIGLTLRAWPLNMGIGVGAWLGSMIGLIILSAFASLLIPQLSAHDQDSVKAIQETFPPMSTLGLIAFMTFVAAWEELVFRGFLLTRLQAMFKRWWLSLPVGAVLFGLGHGYQGPIAVPLTMLLGIALGLLFWWRRSLVPGIVFHAIFNSVNTLIITRWLSESTHS